MRLIFRIALFLFVAASFTSLAGAGTVTQLSSRAGLSDSLDWDQLGAGNFVIATPPFVVTSVSGNQVTVTSSDGGAVVKMDPGIWPSLTGSTLYTYADNGPLTLTFSNPISAIVLNFAPDYTYISGSGPLKATISAFNGATLLGTFTSGGDNLPNNTPVVLGVSDTEAEITSVTIDGLESAPPNPNFPGITRIHEFAIDGLSLAQAAASAPEPGTLLASACALLWILRRRGR